MEKLTQEQFEKNIGVVAADIKKYPRDVVKTADEFKEIYLNNMRDFLGCDWPNRIKWLTNNGYAVTHENIINSDLVTKAK